jgi:methyl-accepting chemotaxis protein
MNAIFTPAARLLSYVSYPVKFAILGFFGALPVVLLSILVFSNIQSEIDSMSQEQKGLRYISTLRTLLEYLPQHRDMTHGFLHGVAAFKPRIEQRRLDINRAFSLLQTQDDEFSEALQLGDRLQGLQDSWQRLTRKSFDVEADIAFSAHTALIAGLIELITHVADTAHLTNDRYLDSRYVVAMLIERIPHLVEPLGQARGQGAGVAGIGSSNALADFGLTVKISRIQSAIAPISHALEVVQRENAELGKLLAGRISGLTQHLDRFIAVLKNEVISKQAITLDASELFSQGTAAVSASFELFDTGLPQLQRLIAQRIDQLKEQRALAIAVVGVVSLLIGWLIGGNYLLVLGSIRRLQVTTARIAEGDLTSRLDIGTKDEMLEIEYSINQLAESFQTLTRKVKEASGSLVQSSDSMTAIVDQTSQGVYQQLDQMTQVATATNEMAATVNEIALNANHTAQSTQQAVSEVGVGKQVVSDSVRSINELATEIEKAATVIQRLADNSIKIGAVIDVINGIAEQTNLLALNAAIEAARAGDQGRGFAVVADEVRTLAARTQRSTQEIREMIESIQTGAKEAVTVMQSSQLTAGKSVEETKLANGSLDSIAKLIQTITDMSAQIATAGEEQSAVTEEINRNIMSIKSVVEKTAEGSGQMNQTASEVNRMAMQLQEITANSTV